MSRVQRTALVEYGPDQMFELVADVDRYPDFLGWVVDARIHQRDQERQLASLTVNLGGITRRITTRNFLEPYRRLTIQLEEGPFSRFSGVWSFAPAGNGCRVALELEFSFNSALMAAAFQRGFARVADRMVDDFCRRADALYA